MSHVVEDVTLARASDKLIEPELDATVAAYDALKSDYVPQLVAGTESGPGTPSHGRVTALRRVGNKLVATVETAHASIAAALRSGAKLTVSLYHDLKRGGRHYARALRAVNLPSTPAPELPALVPSGVMEFSKDDYSRVCYYTLDDSRDGPGEQVDALVRAYMEETGTTSYSEAMDAVLAENPDLRHEYAMSDNLTPEQMDAQRWQNAMGGPDMRSGPPSPGERIQKLVAAEIAKNPVLSNTEALRRVLLAHPDLAEAYAKHPTTAMSRDAVMGSGGAGK